MFWTEIPRRWFNTEITEWSGFSASIWLKTNTLSTRGFAFRSRRAKPPALRGSAFRPRRAASLQRNHTNWMRRSFTAHFGALATLPNTSQKTLWNRLYKVYKTLSVLWRYTLHYKPYRNKLLVYVSLQFCKAKPTKCLSITICFEVLLKYGSEMGKKERAQNELTALRAIVFLKKNVCLKIGSLDSELIKRDNMFLILLSYLLQISLSLHLLTSTCVEFSDNLCFFRTRTFWKRCDFRCFPPLFILACLIFPAYFVIWHNKDRRRIRFSVNISS